MCSVTRTLGDASGEVNQLTEVVDLAKAPVSCPRVELYDECNSQCLLWALISPNDNLAAGGC